MFASQPGAWILPWDELWAHHQGSRLRGHHPGQADREARESSREDESPPEDHLYPDDDRSPTGLLRIWARAGWRRHFQRGQRSVEPATPLSARRRWNFTSRLAGIGDWFGNAWRGLPSPIPPFTWVLFLLLLVVLEDTRPGRAPAAYNHAVQTFQRGDLAMSQQEAASGAWQFQFSAPDWAAKFILLQAETMARRGLYNDALRLLAGFHSDSSHPEETVRKLAIEADA